MISGRAHLLAMPLICTGAGGYYEDTIYKDLYCSRSVLRLSTGFGSHSLLKMPSLEVSILLAFVVVG